MPVNDRYPLRDVLDACLRWHERRKRQVFIEYLMLDGVNDRYEQAVALADAAGAAARVQGQPDPLQPDRRPGTAAQAATRSRAFRAALEQRGVRATVRLTRGRDIDAACGQLAARRLARSRPGSGRARRRCRR